MPTAKLFTSGRSQAVRLPKGFPFDGATEVSVKRNGDQLILSPKKKLATIAQLIAALHEFESMPDRDQPASSTP